MAHKIKLYSGNVELELKPEEILANDVIFKGEYNPHNVRLWVACNEFGVMGAAWACCEQDALDTLADADLLRGCAMDEPEATEDDEEPENITRLGNYGEPYDLQYLHLYEVDFQPARDWQLMVKLAEARGRGEDTLYF
jgi:hypothetical protein